MIARVADLSRIASFPASLRSRCRMLSLGPAPALLVAPEGPDGRPLEGPAPCLLWLHGRTVSKEVDSARLQRVSRAGLAVCAIDLPGHGERLDPAYQAPDALPLLLSEARAELDQVVEALRAQAGIGERLAIGGMSAGGMVALRRLCDPHPFRCVVVEGTAGDFGRAGPERRFVEAAARDLDPASNLGGWRALPLLAFHSEADAVVPIAAMRSFIEAVRARHAALGSDAPVELVTYPATGAPQEHLGFGRLAGDVRARTVEFLAAHLSRG